MEVTKDKILFLIESLRRNGINGAEIHRAICIAWPDDAISYRRVTQIVEEFRSGERQSFERAKGSGRPQSDRRKENVVRVEALLEEDPSLTIRELSYMLDLSFGMIYRIIDEDLERIWFHTKWVPHVLTNRIRDLRVTCCENLIHDFNSRLTKKGLVTIDEKWFYCRKLRPSKERSLV